MGWMEVKGEVSIPMLKNTRDTQIQNVTHFQWSRMRT